MKAIKRTWGVFTAAGLLLVSSVGMASAAPFDPDDALDTDELQVDVDVDEPPVCPIVLR